MLEVLQQHIINRLGNDIDQLDLVLAKFKPILAKRNQLLVPCPYVYFVAKDKRVIG